MVQDLPRRIAEYPAATATLLVALGTVIVWLSAFIFYAQLGATPREVGFGVEEALTRLGVLVGIGLLIRIAIKLVVPRLYGLLSFLAERFLAQRGRGEITLSEEVQEYVSRSGGIARLGSQAISIGGVILALIIYLSFATGRQAADGEPVYPSPGYLWYAPAAQVTLLSASATGLDRIDGRCFLLLGVADGQVVIYDAQSRSSLRLPLDVVAIETGGALAEVDNVLDSCPREKRGGNASWRD